MDSNKIFLGKWVIHSKNQYASLDTATGSLVAVTLTQPGKDQMFNAYGDANTGFWLQGSNGKYLAVKSDGAGYEAKQERSGIPVLFTFENAGSGAVRVVEHGNDGSGAAFCWSIQNGTVNRVSDTAPPPESTALQKGVVSPGAAVIQAQGSAMGADLRWAYLGGENLAGVNFAGADLSNATLTDAALDDAVFQGTATNLTNADFSGASMKNVSLMAATMPNADFSNANLTKASITHVVAGGVILDGANLTQTNMVSVQMGQASLVGAVMQYATLVNGDFRGADLSNADLTHAMINNINFSTAKMIGANLTNLDLTLATIDKDTVLTGAKMQNVNLKNMNLENVTLTHADLSGAILDGALLTGAEMSYVDLSNAMLRNGVQLFGVSLANAILKGADLTGAQLGAKDEHSFPATLTGAYMPNAVLTDAKLYGVNMSGVNWYGDKAKADNADLQAVDFSNANLSTMNFTQARMNGCNFDFANALGTNFKGAVLRPSAEMKPVSFAFANIQGADFTGAQIDGTVFTNAGIAVNDGPYFTLTPDYISDLNSPGATVSDRLRQVFADNGYPLGPNAVKSVELMNKSWKITSDSSTGKLVFNIGIFRGIVTVYGGPIGVHLFNLPVSFIPDLNAQKLTADIKTAFSDIGFPLIDAAAIDQVISKDNKWHIKNYVEGGSVLQRGYGQFVIINKNNKLFTFGTVLMFVRTGDDQQYEQGTMAVATTKLTPDLLNEDTICPNGQKFKVYLEQKPSREVTWEQMMTAATPPRPPKCIPDPFHWCNG